MTTIIPQALQVGYVASHQVLLPTGAVFVVLQALMDAADIATPGTVLNMAIQWTSDGVTPGHAISCVWQSGAVGNVAPGLRMPVPTKAGIVGFAGQLVLPWPIDIGLELDIQDASGNSLPINVLAPGPWGATIGVPVYPVLQ